MFPHNLNDRLIEVADISGRKILEICYKSGVKVVTIYAFSIENFKRSRFEVDALMDMAKVKLTQISQHGALLDRYGAKIQILGERSLVRPDVLESIDKAVDMTSHNTQFVHCLVNAFERTSLTCSRAVLNVCFPYTSRNEITCAVRETVREFSKPLRPGARRPFSETHIARNIRVRQLSSVAEEQPSSPALSAEDKPTATDDTEDSNLSNGSTDDHPLSSHTSATNSVSAKSSQSKSIYPDPEKITADTITSHTFTADAPPCDLLVRTSGVQRLSDFMLWQCHQDTSIVFLNCLWPNFDLWDFLPVLVEWQWKQKKMQEAGKISSSQLHALKNQ